MAPPKKSRTKRTQQDTQSMSASMDSMKKGVKKSTSKKKTISQMDTPSMMKKEKERDKEEEKEKEKEQRPGERPGERQGGHDKDRDRESAKDKKEKEARKASSARTHKATLHMAPVPEKPPEWAVPVVVQAVEYFSEYYSKLTEQQLLAEFDSKLAGVIAKDYTYKHWAKHPNKNRHKDVVCLDSTRVVLSTEGGAGDYIHANWVHFDGSDRKYIATQAPMPETHEDFWRMCFEHQVATVVSLCQDGEVEPYFPAKAGEYRNFGNMFVQNKKDEYIEKFPFHTVEVLPDGCSNSHIVNMVQYSEWPFRAIPSSARAVLRLIRLLSTIDKLAKGPIVVHCLSGHGRTGTFIMIDTLIAKLFLGQSTTAAENLKWLRNQRASAVQTAQQYVFTVTCLFEYLKLACGKHPTKKLKFEFAK